jgi:hypothetical protein
MISKRYWCIIPIFLAAAAWAADDAPWKSKQIPDWTEEDAKDVLADSPWVKTFTATLNPAQQNMGQQRQRGMGGMGGGGIGMGGGGIGMGMPGMGGMGGRRGMGYPGGGGGGYPSNGQANDGLTQAPQVTLRWESAMPVRTAELKVRDNDAPILDNMHYAIAVYGIPDRVFNGDTDKLQDQFKKEAKIKRDGKKDFKPSSVEIVDGHDGRVVVYLFPMTNEITRQDHRVEFNAKIGRLELTQSFFVDDMVWQGKLEL